MEIRDFLREEDTDIDFRAANKIALLNGLATRASRALGLPADTIASALQKREELGSTGIGGGVSMPHARFREIRKPFGLFVRLAHLIAYGAIDGEPVDLAFLLFLPASSQLDQLNALAAVARKLRGAETLARVRRAASQAEFYRAIADQP